MRVRKASFRDYQLKVFMEEGFLDFSIRFLMSLSILITCSNCLVTPTIQITTDTKPIKTIIPRDDITPPPFSETTVYLLAGHERFLNGATPSPGNGTVSIDIWTECQIWTIHLRTDARDRHRDRTIRHVNCLNSTDVSKWDAQGRMDCCFAGRWRKGIILFIIRNHRRCNVTHRIGDFR